MRKSKLTSILLFFLFTGEIFAAIGLPSGFQYISPLPGSKHVSSKATIIVRFKNISPQDLPNLAFMINVTGEKSGANMGETIIASDRRTIIFKPGRIFSAGEIVSVSISPKGGDSGAKIPESFSFHFTVSEKEVQTTRLIEDEDFKPPRHEKTRTTGQPMIMQNGVSVPSDFPHVNISVNNNASGDYIFLNNWGPPYYDMILDTSGAPVWYWKVPDERRDLTVQHNGWLTMMIRDGYGGSGGGYIALNKNYEYIKTFRAKNGYTTDEHELQVLPDSSYFLIGHRETIVDMSQIVPGGQPNATVSETCIQGFTANDQLIFQWRAWDHFDIRDLDLEDLTGGYIRFPHMNAIDIDTDGNILLSSRHLSEITKINRQTGEIIWRLCGVPGSPNNQFQFVNDPLNGFRNQHSIRSQGNGHYTLFDNGNMHNPPLSRAVEYAIDTLQMTATLVWEYRNSWNNAISFYMGNVQRLSNGNTHINWAVGDVLPVASEITPSGERAFEMRFVDGYHCYRSFRYPWDGMRKTPYLLLEQQYGILTLLFNKFGDPNVAYYKIYGDTVSQPTAMLDTSRRTMKNITNLVNGKRYYFRVTAVGSNGVESGFSNEQNLMVNIVQPGVNMIVNGDFSGGTNSWDWQIGGSASATWQIESGVSHLNISSGGNESWDIQLRQGDLPLFKGQHYSFEFDAWTDSPRLVEIKVEQSASPWTNYSHIGFSYLTTTQKHFFYPFEMLDASDNNARVVVNAGEFDEDVYIDNVSLKMQAPSGIKEESPVNAGFALYSNYPNPFNPVTTIRYELPERSHVRIVVYNVVGEEVAILADRFQIAGQHQVRFDAADFSTGIYFYRIVAYSPNDSRSFSETKKMILMR